jgi:hypothetical protein
MMYSLAMSKSLIIGFVLLPIGILVTPLLPEFGVPIILVSTRFLQEKYEWARRLNTWVDIRFKAVKAWFRKLSKK